MNEAPWSRHQFLVPKGSCEVKLTYFLCQVSGSIYTLELILGIVAKDGNRSVCFTSSQGTEQLDLGVFLRDVYLFRLVHFAR